MLKKKNDDKNHFLFNSIVVSNLKRGNNGTTSSDSDRLESRSRTVTSVGHVGHRVCFFEGQSAVGSHCENHKSPKTRREKGWIGFFLS